MLVQGTSITIKMPNKLNSASLDQVELVIELLGNFGDIVAVTTGRNC